MGGKMTSEAKVAVIGGGIVGLSVAYALHRRGTEAVVFDPTPGAGQSAGSSRIFRHQHEDATLTAFAATSRGLWNRWEDDLGVPLVAAGGTILAAPAAVIEERAAQFAAVGLDYRLVDRDQQRAILPVLAPPTDVALLDPRGGAIHAAAAIGALAGALSANIVRESVEGCFEREGKAVLVTPSGPQRFERVVVAAGVDTPALARQLGVEIVSEVLWHVRVSYPIVEREGLDLACWQDRSETYGERVYGTPVPDQSAFAVGLTGEGDDLKIGENGLIANPEKLDQIVKRISAYVKQALPGLGETIVGYRLCPSVSLPGGADDFRAWTSGAFSFVAGGNLFKMAPLLGEQLAGVCVGEELDERLVPAILDSDN
jgi:sarcosine oxidase